MRHLLLALLVLAPLPALAIPNPAVPGPEGRWFAVQLHAHSRYSDGIHPIADLVKWAREGGLDAIAVTDHNTNAHLADPVFQADQGVTVIPAYEWTELEGPNGKHLNLDGPERCHMSVWGIKPATPILSGLLKRDAMLALAAGQDVVIGANHPFEPRFPWPDENFTGVNTVEVWQWQYGLDEAAGAPLPANIHAPHHAPVEFLYRNTRAQALWTRQLKAGHRLTPVAVCDFHVGAGVQAVVSPCTLVWAKSRSVPDLLNGLKAGHVTLVEEPHGPRVELWGPHDAMPGDEVPKGAKLQLRVTGAQGQAVTVFDADGVASTIEVPMDPYVQEVPAVKAGFYYARLDRKRAYNPILSMTGAIFVK
ncbi:MAG: hypothetical protein JWM80_5982 [Cyanobacteria bacterium RYN_339]|nr:hypothetical protein [Cyanobacteria bacterium RYN_339]